jgi:hypothetical protein
MRISEIIVSEGRRELKFQLSMCGVWIKDIEDTVDIILLEYNRDPSYENLSDAKMAIVIAKSRVLEALRLPMLDQPDDPAAYSLIRQYGSLYERLLNMRLY